MVCEAEVTVGGKGSEGEGRAVPQLEWLEDLK
jgi:hypothetical protein